MKAVVLRKPNDLAVLDVPEPEIGPGQALVRMTHCGICGSDIRYLRGDNPWAKQTLGQKAENPPNIILGHEAAGVVEQVGPDCDCELLGRRVAVLAFGTCGQCSFCRRGEEQLCPDTQHLGHGAGWGLSQYFYGGMAERIPVNCNWLFPISDTVTNEQAAMLDPLGVAVHGIKRTGAGEGDGVLIVGCGAVGALALGVARVAGAAPVVAVDLSDGSLAIAARMGADAGVNPARQTVAEVVDRLTAGAGVRAILDTIGAPLEDYLPLLARGGTLVTMTVTPTAQSLSTELIAGERTITSSCNFQYTDFHKALRLLEERRVEAEAIITHRFPLEEAEEAFRTAEDKLSTGAVKVVLTGE